ncbi:Plasminogen activator inhibitor 2 [Lamellibrachia satsuma]|nr:Plasminogen activator inhibitor 2 [Lamellibrachia satsuma]
MRSYGIVCLVLVSLVVSTVGYWSHSPYRPKRDTPCGHRKVVANANRLFGVNLYKKVKAGSGSENIIMSPFSVSAAMAMLYAGAQGLTKQQMRNVLRFNSFPSNCKVHEGFRLLLKAFSATTYNHTLKVVDRVFVDSSFSMPFICEQLINAWVKQETNDKIVDLLPVGAITKDVGLVLVNAITFKGNWEHTFTGTTAKEDFFQSSTKQVDMMHMECTSPKPNPPSLRYAYVSRIRSQVVELPYYNSRVAMYVVLPRKNLALSYVENRFSWNPDKLGMKSRKVEVSLPKFTAKKDTELTSMLQGMGMKHLFVQRKANLRKIAGNNKLWLSNVFHQAYINVDETGTEASAATAACVAVSFPPRLKRAPNVKFIANRPFLFFIWDRQTKSLLFNGRFTG